MSIVNIFTCYYGSMEINKEYTKIMRDLREDADKTQAEIAKILGTSQTMYARYERGANEMPIHHLLILCDYYGVSADYLLGRSKTRKTII